MRLLTRVALFLPFLLGLVPTTAHAQLSVYRVSQPAIGENYHLEVAIGLWKPDPAITINSDRLSVIGSQVDAVSDLGITAQRFREFQVVLRPAKKHKIRFDYVPIKYEPESVLQRTIVFGGVTYTIGLPVHSSLDFKSYRFGYEYDFLYRDRGFIGVIGEVKYTDAAASITSPVGSAAVSQRAPIPAIGGIARGYLAKNVSVTGELTAFKLPNNASSDYYGRDVDFDVYGTVNFSNNVGVQGGYRSMDLTYRARGDAGTMTLKGVYGRVVVRF